MRAYRLLIVVSASLVAACAGTRNAPAPIVDGTQTVQAATPQPAPLVTPVPSAAVSATGSYVVKKGDTLYRIATENHVAARDLMVWNNLQDANIKIGQVLQLAPPLGANGVTVTPLSDGATKGQVAVNPSVETKNTPKAVKEPYSQPAASSVALAAEGQKVATKQQSTASRATALEARPIAASAPSISTANPNKTAAPVASSSATVNTNSAEFGMPTTGKVIRTYSEASKGIDIAGKLGQSIVASAQGKVVYAGAGLRGYGKMVILQHNNGYLTAYAHNDKLLVKEGDVVKKGEKIAEMGNSDADQVKLHFEIRKGGKPIDPSKFIATE